MPVQAESVDVYRDPKEADAKNQKMPIALRNLSGTAGGYGEYVENDTVKPLATERQSRWHS